MGVVGTKNGVILGIVVAVCLLAAGSTGWLGSCGSTTEWGPARQELRYNYRQLINSVFAQMKVPKSQRDLMSHCITKKAIRFLNKSTCKYSYHEMQVTAEQHLQEQQLCMKNIGFEAREAKWYLHCIKEYAPGWKVMRPSFSAEIKTTLRQQGIDPTKHDDILSCAVPAYIQLFLQSACPMINHKAEKLEELFHGTAFCIHQERLGPRLTLELQQCITAVQ